jgi:hypothetical protein
MGKAIDNLLDEHVELRHYLMIFVGVNNLRRASCWELRAIGIALDDSTGQYVFVPKNVHAVQEGHVTKHAAQSLMVGGALNEPGDFLPQSDRQTAHYRLDKIFLVHQFGLRPQVLPGNFGDIALKRFVQDLKRLWIARIAIVSNRLGYWADDRFHCAIHGFLFVRGSTSSDQ